MPPKKPLPDYYAALEVREAQGVGRFMAKWVKKGRDHHLDKEFLFFGGVHVSEQDKPVFGVFSLPTLPSLFGSWSHSYMGGKQRIVNTVKLDCVVATCRIRTFPTKNMKPILTVVTNRSREIY